MSTVLTTHYRADGEWCRFSGVTVRGAADCPYGCDLTVTSRAEWFRTIGRRDPEDEETPTRAWFRDSHGGIIDGNGWEIHRDAPDSDDHDPGEPWSLWRRGEYVGNYATPDAAKVDAHTI